ncbi:MAG: restriction endonuclease, partial [Desulfobacteraceae bacterium]
MNYKNHIHIKEANQILTSLGLPRAQQNDRSALCLLALINLTPQKKWSKAEN